MKLLFTRHSRDKIEESGGAYSGLSQFIEMVESAKNKDQVMRNSEEIGEDRYLYKTKDGLRVIYSLTADEHSHPTAIVISVMSRKDY
ncbi:hypothetical protein AZI86_09765 [Bdellovibrio bacteriovorus]|uniref:Uncharacterized protein n=1 Tax=Bdellovibrio bacteriovorus TaxID=959 RepID=A0A150WSD3_BDEBC|nr:hypothetical protein [Bdellovibrio bacteriovorus]KYG67278.1 hypothetical protein AZI86_09765 [Bdellovibrio bacteriovorus]